MSATLNLTIAPGKDFPGAIITCYQTDAVDSPVFPLAGWKAYAQARSEAGDPIVVDFAPVIAANDTAGVITIPPQTPEETADYPEGEFPWDLILEDDEGHVLDTPYISETLTITRTITEKPAEVTP